MSSQSDKKSQEDKGSSGVIKAAIITGIFAVIAACIGGFFLIFNTMVNNGVFGAINLNAPPRTEIIQTGKSIVQPTIIVVTATTQFEQPSIPVSTRVINAPTVESLSSCTPFQNGETREVAAGTYVIGDITIDGTIQYTDNVGEGTIAYFEREASVFAKWGAGCLIGSKNLLDQVIQGEFQHGCGSACSSIRFVLVQSDGNQKVQMYTK